MKIAKLHNSLQIDFKHLYLTLGFVKGLYLGFQIDKDHISLDFGLFFIDIYW